MRSYQRWSLMLLATLGFSAQAQNVVISEIMYHPASGVVQESYVELLNTNSMAVDLSGWHFTKGIQYVFPANTKLAPGAYLVVASDATAFSNKYPDVTNFVAGWSGSIGNDIRLEDASGQVINEVQYSNDGDWAVRRIGAVMYNHAGWEAYAPHDGLGSSLELINPALPNTYAHNWTSSIATDGTPGQPNSAAQTNAAPFITAVSHTPAIPTAADPVAVSARIIDDHSTGLTVTLFYRTANSATPPAFTSTPMFDDGAHGDALPGDGIFAAILPAQPNSTIIEFYLEAKDLEGNDRVYPAYIAPPTSNPLINPLRTANLLYQVDNGTYTGAQPVYRLIMTEIERAELYAIGRKCPDSDSDAEMNATWITTDAVSAGGATTQVRYNIGVRNRGHGTRQSNPNNYHVNIPGDRQWKKQSGINLNSQHAYSQVLGSAIFRRLEVPMADSRAVQVRINSTNIMSLSGLPDNNSFGSYAANEQYNPDFIKRTFPLDPHGNSYRGIRDSVLCDPTFNGVADLTWHGANYSISTYTNAYYKQNNFVENDWSDIIDLVAVLNSANGYQASNYVADVQRRINVDEWMKYMAINTLIDNEETCLANGVGDDYALYRGTNDTRFLALPYDLDTVMGVGLSSTSPQKSIFLMTNLPVMDRFMKTPQFAPIYYRWLKTLAETTFSPAQMNPLIDQVLNNYVPQSTINTMKAFNASQINYVLSQIPLSLTVTSSISQQSNYYYTTTPTVTLRGKSDILHTWTVLAKGTTSTWSAWQGTWTNTVTGLTPGINRILVQSLDTNGVEIARTNVDVWYNSGSVQTVGGSIATDTTWTAAGGPYSVASSITVANGATLTIEPGTTLYLSNSVNIVVANGGRILAEGTASQPIRFSVLPGSGLSWGGMTINGGVGSPETRIAYAYVEGNSSTAIEVAGGTLYLDHTTFGTTTHQYVSLDNSSFYIANCYFPTTTAPFELLHGNGGIKSGGHGIVRECFFGSTTGYNDIMDFTGGNRDLGQPIIQYYNNVFVGASDDILDLDGTDAWIEGNIFLHSHRNGSPDSSSAVSGGNFDFGTSGGVRTSEITIIGNIFYDCDDVATDKEGNFFTLLNNTIIHITKTGGLDFASGVVNERDTTPSVTEIGKGYYLEGNIIRDVEQLVRNYDPSTAVTFNNNILPFPWVGAGTNNVIIDPMFKHVPQVSETYFTTWEQAQVMRDWLSLLPGSPARGTGIQGLDKGGLIPYGATISGQPSGTTYLNSATITVGPWAHGYGIPTDGFPNGSGFTHYKWALDGGSLSAETPSSTSLVLTNLSNGPHTLTIIGKNDASFYQNDPALGSEAGVSTFNWTVDTSHSRLVMNEILAKNVAAVPVGTNLPDMIELYNDSTTARNLSGIGLSDDPANPYKFAFPANTMIAAGEYLVVYADNDTTTPGLHIGFKLSDQGETLILSDTAANGGAVLDSVTFGIQLPDLSIGRLADGSWGLCQPTFGTANIPQPFGDPHALKINELLASAQFQASNPYIELYNPLSLPVPIGGLYWSDAAGAPDQSPITPLSYIPANGFAVFVADGQPAAGANHTSFKLSADVGLVMLSDPALNTIDVVNYGPQTTDVSLGRTPNGADTFAFFTQPTPGGSNPGTTLTSVTSQTTSLIVMTNLWSYNQLGTSLGTSWSGINYDSSSWPASRGVFYHGTAASSIPGPINTTLSFTSPEQTTFYFRTAVNLTQKTNGMTFNVTHVIDDGIVLYVNGVEVYRWGMPAGSVAYATLAQSALGNATLQGPFAIAITNLVQGTNIIAAEVHQGSTTSSDIAFAIALDATVTTTNASQIPIVVNEVLANNASITNSDGSITSWVELYNPSTNSFDLTDCSFSDDSTIPRRWVFATNSIIASTSYLAIRCDGTTSASPTNTGFGLKATGSKLFLFDSASRGGGLLDAVTFGLQAADCSISRIPDGTGTWVLGVPTPNTANTASVLGSISNLKVNEWMAANPNGPDWFEICNLGVQPVSLQGVSLTRDLADSTQSPIPPLSFMGTGANGFVQFIADKSPASGADHVNFRLSRSGTSIGIYSAAGVLVDAVKFSTQQSDISEGRFPDGSANIVSFAATASPGKSNYLPLPNVVVNELLSHTDPPLEDAVEFLNTGGSDVDISGWYISNTQDNLKKFRVPDGTIVAAGGFKVFYEIQFNPTNASSVPFTFNSAHGDQVYLSQADSFGNLTGYRASASFGAAANGVSFGRYTNSVGEIDFVAMSHRSFGIDSPSTLEEFRTGTGATNPTPLVGPVVINEIMFHPPNVGTNDNVADEFVELMNISTTAVPLYDPLNPTNTWKLDRGVNFVFPQNVMIPPAGLLLVVSFDPTVDLTTLAEFRSRYGVASSVAIYGPYSGHLANPGESIALYKPDAPQLPPHPDAGYVPYVLVDQVTYLPTAPWPTTADGTGFSLQRQQANAYGDDPANWFAALPTAGLPNTTTNPDANGDGLPDDWQTQHFGSASDPDAAPNADPDHDGFTNQQEYLAGTDPLNAKSYLRIEIAPQAGTPGALQFTALAGRSYTVFYRDSLTSGTWTKLVDVPAQNQDHTVPISDTNAGATTRFYILATPAQP